MCDTFSTFTENKDWHFIQIVSFEILNLLSYEK